MMIPKKYIPKPKKYIPKPKNIKPIQTINENKNVIFMVKKYIKKQVEIEAVQFTNENKDQVFRWASDLQYNVYPAFENDNKPCLRIPTLEGEMTCSLGDYLIKEPFPTDWRKLYPCKEEIFIQTYEEVKNS